MHTKDSVRALLNECAMLSDEYGVRTMSATDKAGHTRYCLSVNGYEVLDTDSIHELHNFCINPQNLINLASFGIHTH